MRSQSSAVTYLDVNSASVNQGEKNSIRGLLSPMNASSDEEETVGLADRRLG